MIPGWSNGGANLSQRILRGIRPEVPLKTRIDTAQKRLETQIARLDGIQDTLKKRDAAMLLKIAEAQRAGNIGYARGYAQELAEIRRMRNVIRNAQNAVEGVRTRLGTVAEYGDIVVTLSPCMALIKDIAPGIGSMMPNVSESLGDFEQSMRDILEGASVGTGLVPESAQSNPEANAILDEARAALERDTVARLPTPPGLDIVPTQAERLPTPPVDLKQDVISDKQVYT